MLQEQSRFEGFEFGPNSVDDRITVSQELMKSHPYSNIVLIESSMRGSPNKRMGTGILFQGMYVLTTTHLLFPERADSIKDIYDDTVVYLAPFGPRYGVDGDKWKLKRRAINFRNRLEFISKRQHAYSKVEFDLAVLKLQSPFHQNSQNVIFLPKDIKRFTEMECEIVGYPGQGVINSHAAMKYHRGKILDINNGLAEYQIKTTKGQSGSPIFVRILSNDVPDEQKIVLIGLHSYCSKSKNRNIGLLFTQENIKYVEMAIKSMESGLLLADLSQGRLIPVASNPQTIENMIQLSDNVSTKEFSMNASYKPFNFDWFKPTLNSIEVDGKYVTNTTNNKQDYAMIASHEPIPTMCNTSITATRRLKQTASIIYALITQRQRDFYSKKLIKTSDLLIKKGMISLKYLAFEQTFENGLYVIGKIYDAGKQIKDSQNRFLKYSQNRCHKDQTINLSLKEKDLLCFKINSKQRMIELQGNFIQDQMINVYEKKIPEAMEPLFFAVFLKGKDSIEIIKS